MNSIEVLKKSLHEINTDSEKTNNVKQAKYYRRGIDTLHDNIVQRMLTAENIIESRSITHNDELKRLYQEILIEAAHAIAYIDGEIVGQRDDKDIYNRHKTELKSPGPLETTEQQLWDAKSKVNKIHSNVAEYSIDANR
jgi:hypothetical protein